MLINRRETNMELKENERIDDLELKGLKIIQNINGFCFGMDSVLLSDFAKEIRNGSNVLDLGTGTGILGILLCGKTNLKKITGIEIQKEVAEMANRSIKLNNLQDRFEIINDNIKKLENYFEEGSMDAIVTNPPYKRANSGLINENKAKLISRHEIEAGLEDFIKVSAKILKNSGEFYMVHRPERLVDIMELLRKYKLEPKKLKMVSPNINKEPNLILIKAVKNGKPFLKVEKNLYVYEENGNYTEDILKIYGKEI